MKIAVLGTGSVGNAIGSKLVALGHEVVMGSRTAGNEKATKWVSENGPKASNGTFADAASKSELIVLATNGGATLDIVKLAGTANFTGKVVIDISNPLDFSKGMPPTLLPEFNNTTSLSEEVQKLIPDAHVVKTWNTMNAGLMVNPGMLQDSGTIFISGNSADAKATVKGILEAVGWKHILDLGDATAARGAEQVVILWVRIWGALGTPQFNFKIVQ
jgi:8-hydroxy-5-deazaflavin:NADPH oxidoreductase